jgi:rifampicin phosphotransferase
MGTKASNLFKLSEAGFNIPMLIELPSTLSSKEEIETIVLESFDRNICFAVRSSATNEDGAEQSFAGYFYSEAGIYFNQVADVYYKVVESFKGTQGTVIVQEFIPSEKSGVLFTDNGHGLMVVNSNFGLCKTVVEGKECDEWYLSRETKLLNKNISSDKSPLLFSPNTQSIKDLKSEESLSPGELKILTKTGLNIESLMGSSQDIEWCFFKESLYILQSRPITRKLPKPDFVFYDSANIAESYSGIVSPLTHSFAKSIYKTVYKNLLTASGASKRKVNSHDNIFENMLAEFHGRMYYNMNSWYHMMRFLPGYNRNKSNLENMLTMNVSEDIEHKTVPSLCLKICYPFIATGKLIFLDNSIRKFEKKTQALLQKYRETNLDTFSAKQIEVLYKTLINKLLEKFHITVENDFVLMTFLGILRKKYSDNDLKKYLSFESVSSRQVEKISELSNKLYSFDGFKDVINKLDEVEFKKLLNSNNDAKDAVNNYFTVYGGRFANELKLESNDIEDDTESFLKLLKAYKQNIGFLKPIKKSEKRNSFAFRMFYKYARKREDLRLLRSNSFSLVRRIFLRMGNILKNENKIQDRDDVFYCTIDEVFNPPVKMISLINERKAAYQENKNVNIPDFFALRREQQPFFKVDDFSKTGELTGRSCTPGIVKGKLRVFRNFEIPEKIDFDIIVAKNTDPGWTSLMGLSKGMIIENGGILSHAAIVSRELGIPTVIGVESATKILKTGQLVEINGSTGSIRIISEL